MRWVKDMNVFYYFRKVISYAENRIDPIKYGRKIGAKIGSNNTILKPIWGTEPYLIEIGDNNLISFDVCFLNHDGATHVVNAYVGHENDNKFGKIKIGSNCFIGCRCTILPNVEIGDNSILGAHSLLTKSIPSVEVWGGVPAHFITTVVEFVRQCGVSAFNVDLRNKTASKRECIIEHFEQLEKKKNGTEV